MAGLCERAGDALMSSDRMLDLIGATEAEREIWSVDPGFPGYSVNSRLDSFMVGRTPKFVEYNAESPASIGFCDLLTEIFQALPVMQRWSEGRSLETYTMRRRLLDLLLWAYGEWGGTGRPSLAVIDWDDVLTRRDFEICAEYFETQGVPTVITDPRKLEYRAGRLYLGDQQIDLIYRRVLLHELLDKREEAAGLLRAYQDGAVCIVNSPRSKILHKKVLFALLEDPQLGLELSGEERDIVQRTVPWTRRLLPGTTTYGQETVDLIQFAMEQRERLVLKPYDDYGGRGVHLGWEMASADWERALEAALSQQFILQERVEVPAAEFPIWEGELGVTSLLLDTDPLLFRGKMGGILTRVSGHALLNVSAGTGSTTPTFVVRSEE
jgi:hypothetical protein